MRAPSILNSIIFALLTLALAGCDAQTDNSKPVYGMGTGFPANCRAYVQQSIDSYRSKQFTAEESMAGLERNCGIQGTLWNK